MPAMIEWCDDNDVIKNRWNDLMIIAAESNTFIMSNGAIIRIRQRQFESRLSVLRGVAQGADTYG